MLQPMQQTSPSQPSPSLADFAGLLATLASSPAEPAEDDSLWSPSCADSDVTKLSYDRALRTHARYRPLDHGADRDLDREQGPPAPPAASLSFAEAANPLPAITRNAGSATSQATSPDRNLRTASVTIRLSNAECAQLHQRALQAGLSLSAYLRSCALEAEALRAEVKLALAAFNAENTPARPQESGRKSQKPETGKNTNQAAREESSSPAASVRLTRVFGHIGKLWVGISTGQSA